MGERIDVFISSTARDLEEYRDAITKLILRLGLHPIGMEAFNPTDRNALQLCYDKIQESEIFIGIYAYRYGYAPPKEASYKTVNGIVFEGDGETSITHLEYLWAIERKLPMLLFVVRDTNAEGDPMSWPVSYIEDNPGKSHLNSFKNLIMSRHVVGFFYSPDHLGSQVATGLLEISKMLMSSSTTKLKTQLETLTFEEFRERCEKATTSTIQSIPKYNQDLYVPRETVELEFAEFLASDEPCLLLLGEAGVGKTNFLCDLAKQYSRRLPTLLLRGTTHMSGRLGFSQLIANEISAISKQTVDPANVMSLLNELLLSYDSSLLIIMDAINENSTLSAMRESLAFGVQDLSHTRIKLCISCRDVDWQFFELEHRFAPYLYQPKRLFGILGKGIVLNNYTDEEFRIAWGKYSAHYNLSGILSFELAAICHHPLMMQFLCEGLQGKSIPPGIQRKEIFDQYWIEKVRSRGGLRIEAALIKLAGTIFDSKNTEISELETVDLIGEDIYSKLISERIILYTYRDHLLSQNLVSFTYDAFLEYSIAKYLRQSNRWMRASRDQLQLFLDQLATSVDEFRLMQGVLLYLLLFIEDSTVYVNFTFLYLNRSIRWKLFFCDLVTKLEIDRITLELLANLETLARDNSPQVRWATGNALGYLSEANIEWARNKILSLTVSWNWREREVAAFSLLKESSALEFPVERMRVLAEDINWRVRRAVGYALNHLCTQDFKRTYPLLTNWSKSHSWRLRQAVAKSQNGVFVSLNHTMEILDELSRDPNDEVRWLVVVDLVSYLWHPETKEKAMIILLMILNDGSYLVRKHIATWSPIIIKDLSPDSFSIVQQLSGDLDYRVRWELARSLGRASTSPEVSKLLDLLANDYQSRDVQIAARFSATLTDAAAEQLQMDNSELSIRMMAVREQLARSSFLPKRLKDEPDIFNTWKNDRYEAILDTLNNETTIFVTDDAVSGFLELLVTDQDEGIRWAAATTIPIIDILTIERKLLLLLRLSNDEHYWVRRECISSLEQLIALPGSFSLTQEAVVIIKMATLDPNPEVRFAALSALYRIDNETSEGIAFFQKHIYDDDRQVSAFAQKVINEHS